MKKKLRAVGILFENKKGEILFLLRDDIPSIQFPNQWDVLGGCVEGGETSKEAIKREMKEELELDLVDFSIFKKFNWPDKIETIFYKKLDIDIENTNIHEGQRIQYFPKDKLIKMDLAFHDNKIIREFYKEKEK